MVTVLAVAQPSASAATANASVRLLVGFDRGTAAAEEHAALARVGAHQLRVVGAGAHVVSVPASAANAVLRRLRATRDVRYAEPDARATLDATPNDPLFGSEWAFQNTGQHVQWTTGIAHDDIDAVHAWDVTNGSSTAVVGVIDTGATLTHPDLAPNLWTNDGSVGGCPAGSHGYDTINEDCDPTDDYPGYHGTGVAGVIGAAGNNGVGVAGANWNVQLMPLKALDSTGSGTWDQIVAAIDWAISAKQDGVNLQLLNMSLGGGTFSQALSDEIDKAAANGIDVITSAGNASVDNDTSPQYPCSFPQANVICVAATDNRDRLASFSSYGPASVDLAAPGVAIYTPTAPDGYRLQGGTSVAAPMVTGAAAILLASGAAISDVRSALLANVSPVGSLTGLTVAGGVLDVCRAMPACDALHPPANDLSVSASSSVPAATAFSTVTYTVKVKEAGYGAAGVTLVAPTKLLGQQATASAGSCGGSGVITCQLGSLNNTTATVTITGTVSGPVGAKAVAFAVSSPTPETGPSTNNTTTKRITVSDANADAFISLDDAKPLPGKLTVAPGTTVYWNDFGSADHTATASGSFPLFDVHLTADTAGSWTADDPGVWTYASTAPGDPSTLSGSITVAPRATPSTIASSDSYDVVWSRDSSTYPSTIQYRFQPTGGSWGTWRTWMQGVLVGEAAFSPAGNGAGPVAGSYQFRARVANGSTVGAWATSSTVMAS